MTTEAVRNTEDPGQARPWIPTDETFAARLALIRQRMGWGNVAEAAMACGVPVASWRNWERDGREPRRVVEVAQLIANRTGCDFMWLVAGRIPTRGSGSANRRRDRRDVRTVSAVAVTIPGPSVRPQASRPPNYPRAARRPIVSTGFAA